ncbi:MAG: hypothetical protein NC416_11510 [Eubacterium sp.]|nr:hypothetical protein [Eubacterium sp.]
MAISYLNGAVEVDRELRIEIEKEVFKLVPPKLCECQNLAEAGNLAVQYLKCEKEYNHEERLACLRVLRMIGSSHALEISKSYFQQAMEEDELREIGKLYKQFTITELVGNGIPIFVKEYVIKYCDELVVLHCEMIRIMNFLKDQDIIALSRKKITILKIIDYYDDLYFEWKQIFKNVRKLILYGKFSNTNILNVFSQLNSLMICNLDIIFSIYDLRTYKNIYNITELTIITFSNEYITGKNLQFLKKCEKLGVVLLNNDSELILEDFAYLPKLRELTIGAEFALDFDYEILPENVTILTLIVPNDQIAYALEAQEFLFPIGVEVEIKDLEELTTDLLYGE